MKAKANLYRTLVVAAVAVSVALLGVSLRSAETQTTIPKLQVQDLGTLGGSRSYATGINDFGKVVGNSLTSAGEQHAFLYESTNGMRDLNTLVPADYGRTIWDATAINSKGQIAAIGESFADYYGSSVLTPATTATSAPYEVQALPPVEGDYSLLDATDINDSGHVVGTAWYAF